MKKKILFHINNHSLIINQNIELICEATEFIYREIKKTYKKKGSLFLAGNGGSASDCEHVAGELVGRYKKKRKPLNAYSLSANSSVVTCIANDYGYDKVFERQLQALGQKKDLLIVMSTSGNSKNIINVLNQSKKMGIKSIALLGNNGGRSKNISNYNFIIPSKSTAIIQEIHHLVCHIVCSLFD